MVMFVSGVRCSVSLPYQSIASTDAWPPSLLQLHMALVSLPSRSESAMNSLDICITGLHICR